MTKENLHEIINHYGRTAQKMKAIEELTELQEVIIKEMNGKEVYPKRIQEEIADVHIMLNQLLLIYGISDSAIDAEVGRKMKRTIERMSA